MKNKKVEEELKMHIPAALSRFTVSIYQTFRPNFFVFISISDVISEDKVLI